MVRQKTTHDVHKKLITVIGYTLYAVLVVGVIFSVIIPWMNLLSSAPQANRLSGVIFMAALTAGTLLPMLFAYISGDKSTRIKKREMHHFNGVLFGVLAYWVAMTPFLSSAVSALTTMVVGNSAYPGSAVMINLSTIIFTVIVTSVIGYFYHFYHTKRDGLLVYRPYQLTLLVLVWGGLAWSLVTSNFEWILSTILTSVMAIVVFATVYLVMRHTVRGKLERATLATVWVSLVFIAMYVVSGLSSIMHMY